MASTPTSWLVLRKVPEVSTDQGAGFSISGASPPLISHLTVSANPQEVPARRRVLSADLSAGLFLLPGRANAGGGDSYTVLDAANTYTIPGPALGLGPAPGSLGVIARGTDIMVFGFEYRYRIGNDDDPKAWLHCYSHRNSFWCNTRVDLPPQPRPRSWAFEDVITHAGRIWWLHTTSTAGDSGLLSCDPFSPSPEMVFDAPGPRLIPGVCRHHDCFHVPLVARRCVQVSDGKFRWAQILCQHMEHELSPTPVSSSAAERAVGAPTLLVLTLDHPTAEWRRSDPRHRISFADVWNHDSYKGTGLPRKEPALAVIHPDDPFLVYFSLDGYIFGVDMRTKTVVAHGHRGMRDSDVSSSSLLAWVLPPALRASATQTQTQTQTQAFDVAPASPSAMAAPSCVAVSVDSVSGAEQVALAAALATAPWEVGVPRLLRLDSAPRVADLLLPLLQATATRPAWVVTPDSRLRAAKRTSRLVSHARAGLRRLRRSLHYEPHYRAVQLTGHGLRSAARRLPQPARGTLNNLGNRVRRFARRGLMTGGYPTHRTRHHLNGLIAAVEKVLADPMDLA